MRGDVLTSNQHLTSRLPPPGGKRASPPRTLQPTPHVPPPATLRESPSISGNSASNQHLTSRLPPPRPCRHWTRPGLQPTPHVPPPATVSFCDSATDSSNQHLTSRLPPPEDFRKISEDSPPTNTSRPASRHLASCGGLTTAASNQHLTSRLPPPSIPLRANDAGLQPTPHVPPPATRVRRKRALLLAFPLKTRRAAVFDAARPPPDHEKTPSGRTAHQ